MNYGNNFNQLLTVAEVAAMHRVARRTVDRWIKSGRLPSAKLPGGHVRISREDAEALLTPNSPVTTSLLAVAGAPSEAVAS